MSKKTKQSIRTSPKTIISIVLSLLALTAIITLLMRGNNLGILAPAGSIADEQRQLIIWTCLLSLIVVIPVFVMAFYIVWKYRVGNKKAKYQPNMHGSAWAEAIWWLVPLALIAVLAVVTWISTHKLDPYKPLKSDKQPITVQVVALNWKWLFIYPEQDIATVNYMQFPTDTPVNFKITADAPMNSFWIPQLAGQIYAMAGMQTELHLIASKAGTYPGSSANLSGEGFAGMKFNARATSKTDFDRWVKEVKRSAEPLSAVAYGELSKPSKNNPVAYYSSRDSKLYDTILMKYMMPGADAQPDDKDHDAAHNEGNTRHDAGADAQMDMNMEHGHH